jgi:predicted DNA-binding transcriptional regulator AlpA
MEHGESLSREQMGEFLRASEVVRFAGQSRVEVYAWVQETLLCQEYFRQGKKQRGLIRAYLSKVSGRSLPQLTRLIRQYRNTGQLGVQAYQRQGFPRRYSDRDVALLAAVDQAHQWLSGPATKHILEREFAVFGKAEFQCLAEISVSHLYNLRRTTLYRKYAARWEPTRPTCVSIGERRRPDPQGRPGYLRVDTVHQGDWEGAKGVYHLNAVDAVTQWEVVGCTARISEHFLAPVLEAMLHQFPFPILGFHADNGSEFINHTVAGRATWKWGLIGFSFLLRKT